MKLTDILSIASLNALANWDNSLSPDTWTLYDRAPVLGDFTLNVSAIGSNNTIVDSIYLPTELNVTQWMQEYAAEHYT